MTKIVQNLVERYFAVSGGRLIVGGLPIDEIVRQFGTPAFVYDPAIFKAKLARLRSALSGLNLYYSVKANPTPAIIKVFVEEGCGIEIASSGELALALKAGCPKGKILFAGPGKTERELTAAIEAGVSEIHVESLAEIERLAALAGQHGKICAVAIRINPSEEIEGGAMVMGGVPSPFGIDEEELAEAIQRVRSFRCLDLCGLHCYAGTQILDVDVLINMYRHYINLARRICKETGQPIRSMDFGGGYGVPYFENNQELQVEEFGRRLLPIIDEARAAEGLRHTKFMVEPGRYLVSEAGIYAARITEVKVSRGKRFIILDGGMNHYISAAGHLGQVIKRNFPLALGTRMQAAADTTYDIVGPLCTPLDTLGRDVKLPHAEPGDIVVFFQAGAYGRSASPLRFLSHPEPPEIFVEGGAARLVRRRGSDDDLLSDTIVQ